MAYICAKRMGVTGFWRHVVGRAGAKEDTDGTGSASQYLSDVAEWLGKAEGEKATVAVDVSLILYNAVKTLEAARQLDVVPKIPVTAALKHLQRCHDLLVKNGIVPVYVFDGARNPYKGDTNAAREAGRKAAEEKLRSLVKQCRTQDAAAVDKLRKETAYPREDVLEAAKEYYRGVGAIVVCAAFEAEWQCVALERYGLVDAVYSEDGDIIVSGANNIMSLVNWTNDLGRCCLYKREEIMSSTSGGGGKWNNNYPELLVFCGNDYTKRLFAKKESKKRMTMPQVKTMIGGFVDAEDTDLWLERADSTYYWPNETDPTGDKVPAIGFGVKCKEIAFMIRHAPVFMPVAAGDGPVDLTDPSSYTCKLVPLNDLPAGVEEGQWGAKMGWPSHPADLIGADANIITRDRYAEAFRLEVWPRTGQPLTKIELPTLPFPPHYQVGHCSYVDYEHTPVEHWPRFVMRDFLLARDKLKKGKVSDSLLRKCCEEVLRQEGRDLGDEEKKLDAQKKAKWPKQAGRQFKGNSYQDLESLMAGENGISWNSDAEAIFAAIREVVTIDQQLIDRVFGTHNGVLHTERCSGSVVATTTCPH